MMAIRIFMEWQLSKITKLQILIMMIIFKIKIMVIHNDENHFATIICIQLYPKV